MPTCHRASAATTATIVDGSITPLKLSVPLAKLQSSDPSTGVIYLSANASTTTRSITMTIPANGQVMVAAWCGMTTGTAGETRGREDTGGTKPRPVADE